MKFSTKAEYGLRAIMHLVSAEEPVSLGIIAEAEGLSQSYLERIFAVLKNRKIVKSYQGVNGGYMLVKKAEKITVAEVILALEGTLYQFHCSACRVCNCKINPVWEKLAKQINKTLSSITLKSLK